MGVAPYKRLMHGDWISLERIIDDLYRILNADTTLSGMASDTTAISSDLDIAESNIVWMESDIDTNTSDIVVLKSDVITNASDILAVAGGAGSSSDVATNTSDIVVLKSDILSNDSDIVVLKSDIAAEKSDTVIFKSNLLWMESDIDTNTSDLLVVAAAAAAIGGADTQVQYNNGGVLGGTSYLTLNDATGVTTATGLTVTGNSVLGLNSAVFQPAADAIDFFQVKNAAGTSYLMNGNTTNGRMVFGSNAAGTDIVHIYTPSTGVTAMGLTVEDTATAAQYVGGGILFKGNYSGTTPTGAAGFKAIKTNSTAGHWGFGLNFYTRTHGSSGLAAVLTLDDQDVGQAIFNTAESSGVHTGVRSDFTGVLISTGYAGTGRVSGVISGFNAQAIIENSVTNGTTGELRAGNYAIFNNDAGTVVTYASGIKIDTPTNAGTFTNTYGLYIFTQVAGTQTNTPFGIYQAGAADINYFAGLFGIGEPDPETVIEITHATPYITLHNSTHEDTDGGGEVRIIGKREDGAGTETAAGQIEICHDGAGVNDQLGKIIESVNTGAGLVAVREVDSSGNTKIGDGGTTNYTNISAVGHQTMLGTARVEKEILISLQGFGQGVAKPDESNLGNYKGWAFDVGDLGYFYFEVPHDCDVTMPIIFAVHWYIDEAGGGTKYVNWGGSFTATNEGTETVDHDTDTISSGNVLCHATAKTLMESTIIIAGDTLAYDDLIGLKMGRIAVTDAVGEPTADPVIVGLEVEYTSDRLGEGLT